MIHSRKGGRDPAGSGWHVPAPSASGRQKISSFSFSSTPSQSFLKDTSLGLLAAVRNSTWRNGFRQARSLSYEQLNLQQTLRGLTRAAVSRQSFFVIRRRRRKAKEILSCICEKLLDVDRKRFRSRRPGRRGSVSYRVWCHPLPAGTLVHSLTRSLLIELVQRILMKL